MPTALIALLIYMLAMIVFVVTGFVKGTEHMNYLKEVFPRKYEVYGSYFSTFKLSSYNVQLQFLIFPCFKRFKDRENEAAQIIAKRVKFYLFLNCISIIVMLSPLLWVFFKEKS